MTELKPCPFCGGEAEIVDMLSNRYHVRCTNCPAYLGEVWGDKESPQELTKLWNTRANEGER